MKKIFFILFISVFFIGVINAASITVDKPNASSTWYIGDTYTIYWTKNGQMDDMVRIRLKEKNCGPVKEIIVTNTDNDGKYYPFTIPASVQPGTYSIIVRTMDGDVWGCSKNFRIEHKSPLKYKYHFKLLHITKPEADAEWEAGEEHQIEWVTSGFPESQEFNIYLCNKDGTNHVMVITKFVTGNSHLWTIPLTKYFATKKTFTIKVITKDGTRSTLSKPFDIIPK